MTLPYIDSEVFSTMDFTQNPFQKAEYDNCTFTNCNFTEADLSSTTFIECEFNTCNFSNANIKYSIFREVDFIDCKMIGLQFQECNPFLLSFNFSNCQLQFSSFFRLKLKGIKFSNCNLNQVNFAEADLSNGLFDNCDFKHAVFEQTNLKSSDLSSSENFIINPENNTITKAKFSKENVMGLLHHYQINIV
ncbi:pentapeptide repeat-containing protein [Gelidibacter sp.]|uniref:pentapeptide repeat-containing protein n=1 Tax=Gelidibacter sp. TaxID=2018083 RepID=UPI002C29F902|nr:pentapeptide repeat-containing protein [Gelidibacter sp.]HUH28615.1 pentapeptide repeat-containing protein [Gelidibacter sp.]